MSPAGNRLWLTFLSLLFTLNIEAQIPLIRKKATQLSTGYLVSFPMIMSYFDHSVTRGTDYFWEYEVEPGIGSGFFLGVSRLLSRDMEKGFGFLEYGLEYKRPSSNIRFNGWEGGGGSNVFYHGEGTKSWTDHYLTIHLKMTHHFFVGPKQHDILNSLAFALENRICQVREFSFVGVESHSWGNVAYSLTDKDYSWITSDPEFPQMRLYYEFGWVFRSQSGAFIPVVKTSLLNLTNFIPQKSPVNIPLDKNREYYKEILIGLSWIPAAVKN